MICKVMSMGSVLKDGVADDSPDAAKIARMTILIGLVVKLP